MRTALRPLGLVAVVLAIAACPPPSSEPQPLVTGPGELLGPPVSAILGPDGGRLASADGRLSLVVPPGALAAAATLSITPTQNLAPGGLGQGYELSSGGAGFGLPLTLTFTPAEEDRAAADLGLMSLAWQDDGGVWRWVEDAGVDLDAGTLTLSTTHFTRFGPAVSSWLVPLFADVKEGQSVQLEVQQCYAPHAGTGGMVGIACTGGLLEGLVGQTSAWSVNATLGGNATLGTVVGTGRVATYTAPATAPSPPTVTVTASVQLPAGLGKGFVYSNLHVGEVVDLQGTITFLETMSSVETPFTVEASAVLLRRDTGPEETNYLLGGHATIRPTEYTDVAGTHCTLKDTGAQSMPTQDAFKVRLTPQVTVTWSYSQRFVYRCKPQGLDVEVERELPVQFRTGPCGGWLGVPTANPKAPRGSFQYGCSAYSTLAAWRFEPD